MFRYLKVIYLLIGLALLAVVMGEIDLAEVGVRAAQIGALGMTVVLGIYFIGFVIDSFTWQMALTAVPLNPVWLYRAWKVRMVGEVFNTVIPAAGMGGEPVKAVLLKKHYGIGYREGMASIVLGKTINMMALVAFLAVGFAFMWRSAAMPSTYKVLAASGLAAFGLGTALFFAVQRLKITSLAGIWLSRLDFAKRLEEVLHHIHDFDERLVRFYTRHKGRFAWAVVFAFVNWMMGVLEVYYALSFLGRPVTLSEAWIIEAAAQLVRAGTFFIPASIGAQEGAFLLISSAVTGSPALGVALAVVRRFREVLWLLWGASLGAMFSFRAGPIS